MKFESTIADDDSILVGGENHNENNYVITAKLHSPNIKAIRMEALPHDSLPQKGPGRAGNGNFVITEFIAVRGLHPGEMDTLKKVWDLWPEELKQQSIQLENATATIEQALGGERHPNKKWAATSAIDRDLHGSTWGWAVLPDTGKTNEMVLQITDGEELPEDVTFVIQQYHGQGSHTLGHFRLSATEDPEAIANPFHSLPNPVKMALEIAKDIRTPAEDKVVADYFVSIAPQFAEVNNQLQTLTRAT